MSALQELKQLAALSADPVEAPAAPFNAYVHVAYGYDARTWQKNWRAGKILGLNEEFPYGYHHAAQFGATVIYSKDHPENALQKIMRYGLRFFLGFDFIHAWRNRAEILRSDVVWTHTESQTLAVLGLLTISKHAARPKLIGQVIWLIDEWHRLNYFRKALLYETFSQSGYSYIPVALQRRIRGCAIPADARRIHKIWYQHKLSCIAAPSIQGAQNPRPIGWQ